MSSNLDSLKSKAETVKQVITISDKAAERIKYLLKRRDRDSLGIRVGIKPGGCSGLSYYIEYVDNESVFDEVVTEKGVTVFIDPKALMYLVGTEMDYVEDRFKSGFNFINPNQKNSCGCGKSFSV